ncbi:hypothetical protein BRD17_07155 [Halobacteriales archaeon SW_7_68_16]|nr:MAG: hypothetical protein BRD17_07155 [Halobacteriales archaeon SW_7_68_16]
MFGPRRRSPGRSSDATRRDGRRERRGRRPPPCDRDRWRRRGRRSHRKLRRPTTDLPGGPVRRLHGELARVELVGDADEAIVRDPEGAVVGGTQSAICLVTDSGLHAPGVDPVPAAVTRSTVVDVAIDADLPVHRGRYGADHIREAAEVLLVSARWGVRPVERVDGIAVGGGPVTDLLVHRFDRLVERRCYGSDRETVDLSPDRDGGGGRDRQG